MKVPYTNNKFDFAVLRFRALAGTETLTPEKYAEKCQQALFDEFSKAAQFLETSKKLRLVPKTAEEIHCETTEFLERKMFCFNIGLQPVGYSTNQLRNVRVYVAAQMEDTAANGLAVKEYCNEKKISIIDNLFAFSQMGYDPEQGSAEETIVCILKEKLLPYGN